MLRCYVKLSWRLLTFFFSIFQNKTKLLKKHEENGEKMNGRIIFDFFPLPDKRARREERISSGEC